MNCQGNVRNRQEISHCLESGHPEITQCQLCLLVHKLIGHTAVQTILQSGWLQFSWLSVQLHSNCDLLVPRPRRKICDTALCQHLRTLNWEWECTCLITVNTYSHDRVTALYPGQPDWASTRTLRNIHQIYHSPNSSKALPTFPSQPPSLPLGFNTKENPGKQLKETRRTRGQEPMLLLSSLNTGSDFLLLQTAYYKCSLYVSLWAD